MATATLNVLGNREIGGQMKTPRFSETDTRARRRLGSREGSREPTNVSVKMSRKAGRVSRQTSKLSRNATEVSLNSNQGQVSRGSRRKSQLMFKNLDDLAGQIKKTMPPGWNIREGFQALNHFRKIVKFIITFTKWIMAMREEAEKTGGAGSEAITGLANQDFATAMITADGTEFDVRKYASKKEVTLSAEVQKILNTHPTLRTADQIQLAKYGLQHIQSFSEYPLHMQDKLATVAYYQEVEAKRVIIRQGHVAENFYFILSGAAFVSRIIKNDDGTTDVKYEKLLNKGDSFGELELLHHSNRQVTVVSKVPMKLLVVGRDNFFKIFMESQIENELPEHIRFFASLDLMKGFPIDKLAENPQKCLLHFFRRGSLIVKDSQESEWLYIIKSGTCQVLKMLKSAPDMTKSTKPVQSHKSPTDFSLSLPRLGIAAQASRTDSGLKVKGPPKPKTPREKVMLKNQDKKANLDEDLLAKDDDQLPLLMMERSLEGDEDLQKKHQLMLSTLDIPMEPTTPHRAMARNNKLVGGYTKSKFSKFPAVKGRQYKAQSLPHYAPDRLKKTKVHFSADHKIIITEPDDTTSENAVPSINAAIAQSQTVEAFKKPLKQDPQPVYVQVDLLKPRDVFGLANIRFDEFLQNKSLSVVLVSRGAECIMVEKKFFVDHAPGAVKHAVMSQVRPYPEAATLQGNLELKATWEGYREDVLRESGNNVMKRKQELKKTFSL